MTIDASVDRLLMTGNVPQSLFQFLHEKHLKLKYAEVDLNTELVGSDMAREMFHWSKSSTSLLKPSISSLVEYVCLLPLLSFSHLFRLSSDTTTQQISKEASSFIQAKFGVVLDNLLGRLGAKQLNKAEAILMQIAESKGNPSAEQIEKYHQAIPLIQKPTLATDPEIQEQFEIIQLLRDLMVVSEGLGGNALVDQQYRSLRCHITDLKERNPVEHQQISDFIRAHSGSCNATVHNIYHIVRESEQTPLPPSIGNKRSLSLELSLELS